MCTVEADQLEQTTSRRDSVKPSSPLQPQLFFCPYITSFEKFITRLKPIDDNPLSAIQQSMVSVFSQEQKEVNSFFRVFSLLVDRTDMVGSAYDALLSYLRLSSRIALFVASSAARQIPANLQDATFDDSRRLTISILELATAKLIPAIVKTHPDLLPANFHSEVIDLLVSIVNSLGVCYDPPGTAEMLEREARFDLTAEGLFHPKHGCGSSLTNNNSEQIKYVAYRLGMYDCFIRSHIMALRVTGLGLLGSCLLQVWTCTRIESESHTSHPLLHFTARCLLSNDFVPYIFGPDSHADLIRRSTRVVEFLVSANYLTVNDADIVWNTCLQNPNADAGQASYHVLLGILHSGGYAELMYLCKKYETLLPSQLSKPLLCLFGDIIAHILQKPVETIQYFECACVSVRLLQRVSEEWSDSDINQLRFTVSKGVTELLSASEEICARRHELLEMCSKEIKEKTLLATGSVYIFLELAACCLRNVLQPYLSEILSFKDVTDELCHYVNDIKSQEPNISFSTSALHSRIRLAHLMLAYTPTLCDADTEKMFWSHVIGVDAVNDEARSVAWHALFTDLANLPALTDYLERSTKLYLPTIPPACGTSTMLLVYQYAFERTYMDHHVDLSVANEFTRFALTTVRDDTAEEFMTAAITAMFYNAALKHPGDAINHQVTVVEKCIDCITTSSKRQQLRAIRLLRKLLQHSSEFDRATRAPSKDPVTSADLDCEKPDIAKCSVQVWSAVGPAIRHTISIQADETFQDLQRKIAEVSLSDDFIVICDGRLLDFTTCPTDTISTSDILGKSLIVKNKNTLQSIQDNRAKQGGRTTLERAILKRFDCLYAQLDGTDESCKEVLNLSMQLGYRADTSVQIFWLLADLRVTTAWEPVSMDAGPLRILFSVHHLSVELQDQLSLGVADASFILKGVHALVSILERYGGSTDWLLLRFVTQTFSKFLRGMQYFRS